jgi:AAA family ATP:ADP antiporter
MTSLGASVGRLVKVLPNEAPPVAALGGLLLLNSLAMQLSYVSSISGFLQASGAEGILLVWLADFSLILLLTGGQSLVVDRFARGRLMVAISLAFAAAFLTLRALFALGAPEAVNYALLYVVAEQQWLFFPLVFWTLANDHFSPAQASRVFPVIGSWGFVGQILGLGLAASAPLLLPNLGVRHEDLLLLNAAIYLVAVLVVTAFARRSPAPSDRLGRPEGLLPSLREGVEFVRNVPSFRYLAVAIVGLAVCETVVEFRFLSVSGAAFASVGSYQEFYGFYRLATTAVAFLLQLLVTSRVIGWLGIRNSFYLTPLFLLSSAAAMILMPGLAVATGAMALVKLSRDTIDETSRKAIQNIVPEERRGRVSAFLDSHLLALGTILACLITLAVLGGARLAGGAAHPSLYLLLGVAGALVALFAVRRMTLVYDSSLLNWRLRRRQRATSLLEKLDF